MRVSLEYKKYGRSKVMEQMRYFNAPGSPRKSRTDKCIVIDLDQTLIATQPDFNSLYQFKILSDPKLMELRSHIFYITIEDLEKPGIGTKYDFWGIIRPHVKEFLKFCFSYFKVVAFWSAGKRPYVEAIVDIICQDLPVPDIIFTHDDIVMGPAGVEKPLTKMFKAFPALGMTLQNTFILDDNATTFIHNQKNGILIPAYEPKSSIEAFNADDPALLQLMQWLSQPEVMQANDVTKLNTHNIFNRGNKLTYV